MFSEKDYEKYQKHIDGECADDCKYCEMDFKLAVEDNYKDVKKEKEAKFGKLGKAIKRL